MTFHKQPCITRRDIKEEVLSCSRFGNRPFSDGSCRKSLDKAENMVRERLPRSKDTNYKRCTCATTFLLLLVIGGFMLLQFAVFSTGGHVVTATRIEGRRILYFLAKSWRGLIGISKSNFTYPGLVPPYVLESRCSRSSALQSPPCNRSSTPVPELQGWEAKFNICLSITIGDDGGQPREGALPYQLVYTRLFRSMNEDVDGEWRKKGRGNSIVSVLVAVDYKSIVCKMLRDFVDELPGLNVSCKNFEQLRPGIECGTLILGSTKRFVPQLSPLFCRAVKWDRECHVDLDCSRPEDEAPSIPQESWRPTVVTGFSSNHMTVGLLMLRSLGKAAREAAHQLGSNGISVVVYAMEIFNVEHRKILDCVVEELISEYNVHVEVRIFDFSSRPKWMRINQTLGYFGGTGEYAWKAEMVHTVLRERGMAVWADAGNRFMDTPALVESLSKLRSTGFISRKSHGTIMTRTHPLHLKFLRADLPGMWDLPNCEAAIVGFTLSKYKEFARPWYECSMIRQCIAPDGSDRSNHRQDQAALSVLSVISGNPCVGGHPHFGHHMDDNALDSELVLKTGVSETRCYVDPLELDMPQGTHLGEVREGTYIWH